MRIDSSATAFVPQARWAEHERDLYETVRSNPADYERLLATMRDMVEGLRHIEALDQLNAAWSDAVGPGAATVNERLLGAAFAMREREIRALHVRHSIRDRLEDARGEGHAWVVLEEAGDLDAGLLAPYRSTEMHMASGLAILSTVQANIQSGAPTFVAAVVRLDPASGELVDPEPGLEDWKEHDSREAFMASTAALRARIEAGGGGAD